MDIQIKYGEAQGMLRVKNPYWTILPDDLLRKLVNFAYWMTYDWFSQTYTIEMRGSIISMMQFRKLILIYHPDMLE